MGTDSMTWTTGYVAMRRVCGIALLGLPLLLPACTPPGPVVNHRQSHVLCLPGIGGSNPVVRKLVGIINKDMEGYSAQTWDWTDIEKVTPLGDLVDEERNRMRAKVLADELVVWRQEHPDTNLYLSATSGGAGIVLFTCEALPEDFEISRVVFISAALSRDADLSPILRRSRGGIFNYYSRMDAAVLGLGTTIFGTTDRKHAASAGLVGFDPPRDPSNAGKLEQLAWRSEFVKVGNLGGHTGGFADEFLRTYVLPEFRE